MSPWTRRVVVLVAGSSTMALQMCASRLLSPWVGGSSYMWATVIGLSLLAMSVGYLLGGRLADRRPEGRLLGRLLLEASLAVALIPWFAGIVLPRATLGVDGVVSSVLVGSAVGYAVLFAMPAVLLGMVPPFVIRLALTDTGRTGRTAGGLYALSTVGSIVGTLGSVLLLIQWIGTRATLWVIAAMLLAAGALALAKGSGTVLFLPAVFGRAMEKVAGARVLPGFLRRGASARAGRAAAFGWPTREAASGAAVPAREPANEPTRGAEREAGREPRSDGARPGRAPLAMGVATAIVVVEGMATMAGEMGAARLIAPFYGASTIVWANLIALVMASIALGSWLGGRLADRRPDLPTLAMVVTAGGVATALLPFVAGPIMRLSTGGIDAVDVGTVVGSFFGSVALLIVPMTLLGMVPPFVIRLAVPDVEHAGGAAGRLYAASTGGALVGTFGSVLLLIPAIGTRRTLLLVGALPVLLALAMTWRSRRMLVPAAAGVVLMVLAVLPVGYVKPLGGNRVIFEGESRYQFVQVVEDRSGRRLLQLNEGWAVHSIYDPRTVLTGGIWDHFLVLPAMLERGGWDAPGREDDRAGRPHTESCARSNIHLCAKMLGPPDSEAATDFLIIGNAAGTAARAYDQLRPNVDVDGVELDPLVTEVGNDFFHMGEADPDITAADGRPFLAGAERTWDVIHVDAYRQPYIPFYLTTEEFFETVDDRLARGGVISINVGSTPEDDTINRHVAATMREVFPLVARYRAEEYNEVIVGVKDPDVTLDELRERIRSSDLARGDAPVFDDGKLSFERQQLAPLFEDFAVGLREVEPNRSLVLTDDRAPVEWMTDRMIFGAAG